MPLILVVGGFVILEQTSPFKVEMFNHRIKTNVLLRGKLNPSHASKMPLTEIKPLWGSNIEVCTILLVYTTHVLTHLLRKRRLTHLIMSLFHISVEQFWSFVGPANSQMCIRLCNKRFLHCFNVPLYVTADLLWSRPWFSPKEKLLFCFSWNYCVTVIKSAPSTLFTCVFHKDPSTEN